ncbi:sensor histidine kinase [Pseudomonas panipatensis]|uniref:histidine kinase n=1 Tax=Pseudomonas panipatensis TaxID=428992 RepID=A0A1G8MTC0_9PSED|nr:ATP-binding protein [Pseudomonas panipatensis]SDI71231.1 two-component system, NarL family, nitrate/nitrite sensor histidine kinase NarX [Pseudomonas panipatensis]SMP78178.1 two-component system, NarL family, nitrate/nitrite sensor histidine kinase NarX [Pseudomonas panipatensis]
MVERRGQWRKTWAAGGTRGIDAARLRAAELALLGELLEEPGSWSPLARFMAALGRVDLRLLLEQSDLPAPLSRARDCCGEAACPLREPAALSHAQACATCLRQGRRRLLCPLPAKARRGYGVLLLDDCAEPESPAARALQPLLPLLASACQGVRRLRARQRIEQHGQNSALARELHDSVAQQLGFLSFQANRLHGQLQQPEQATALLDELRRGLSGLQRQVRELISNARLSLDGRSLRQALADSLDEFGRRSQIVFDLDNRFPDGLLDDEEELQILQIVREALANIVRHSHARSARIELRQADGALCVQVEDDGIGLQGGCAEGNHFGLSIMQERAASIGASLRVEGLLPQGTRVGLWLALGERGADHGQGQYQEEPASASQRHLAADR